MATLFTIVLIMVSAGALYLFVENYYGSDGVRLVGVILGIALIVLSIIGVGALVQFIAYRMSIEHHDNVVRGLVHAQQADDRGEIARAAVQLARSGNQVDSQMLRMADRLSRERQAALEQRYEAQRQLEDRRWQDERQQHDRTVDGQADWQW
jgi:hypothetical protein